MPVTRSEVREFEKKVKTLEKGAGKLSDRVRVEVQKIVDDHRRIIKELIGTYPAKEPLPTSEVPKLSTQIRAEVDSMLNEAADAVKKAQEGVYLNGVQAGSQLISTLKIKGVFFAPSTDLIHVATNYSADLIRSISTDLLPKVNGVLSRAALGSLSPHEAMQELDKLIGRAASSGVSAQAEMIIRTEVERVYSIALNSQMQSLVEMVEHPKKIEKEWMSGPNRPGRRQEHQQMDGQRVPVDEPFVTPSGNKLMYPRDPAGPAEEVISCGCSWRIVPESLVDAMK